MKIHSTQHIQYFLGDTYRAAHPLYTIVQEKRTLDFIKTFLDQYKRWCFANVGIVG